MMWCGARQDIEALTCKRGNFCWIIVSNNLCPDRSVCNHVKTDQSHKIFLIWT